MTCCPVHRGHILKHSQDQRFLKFFSLNLQSIFEASPHFRTLTKIRVNGDILLYHPATNTFAVSTITGLPRTMFKPSGGLEYWKRQK